MPAPIPCAYRERVERSRRGAGTPRSRRAWPCYRRIRSRGTRSGRVAVQVGVRPLHIQCHRVGPIKTIWASVQGDPVFMRRVNGWLTIFWLAMIPVSLATGWVNSVVYVSALSLWALVSGHWSAWQAARVEVNQEAEAKLRAEEDIAGQVVDAVIEKTTVEPA
jgi:hypothetical protein